MNKTYRVRNWSDNFENNRTRKMKHMMWIPVPNKHDGDGYTELIDRENGAEMLGAWIAILQVASKCAERGTLVRDNGSPHTAKTISRQTRIKEQVIESALCLLCSDDVAWLEVVYSKHVAGGCAKSAPITHPTDEEGNGIERNRIEGTEGVEEKYPHLLQKLKDDITFDNAIACIYACNDSFLPVPRFALENSLKGQPNKEMWIDAIEGMTAKFAGVEMDIPNNSLKNWLAGKPENKDYEPQEWETALND